MSHPYNKRKHPANGVDITLRRAIERFVEAEDTLAYVYEVCVRRGLLFNEADRNRIERIVEKSNKRNKKGFKP